MGGKKTHTDIVYEIFNKIPTLCDSVGNFT